MDCVELTLRWKRAIESYITYRRAFLLVTLLFCIVLYTGPTLLHWLSKTTEPEDVAATCLDDRLIPFYPEADSFDAVIQHVSLYENEPKTLLPFVGNGLFGVEINNESPLYIKVGRTLSLPILLRLLVKVKGIGRYKEAIVTHYLNGIVYRYQCFSNGVHVAYEYYAHRTLPSIFVQTIQINNPVSQSVTLRFDEVRSSDWSTAVSQTLRIQHDNNDYVDYKVFTGLIEDPTLYSGKVITVSIVTRKGPLMFEVKAKSTLTVHILTAIYYSKAIFRSDYATTKEIVERECIKIMETTAKRSVSQLKEDHIAVWRQLWSTGISISYSKAADAINGNQINATMYYVLSNVRSFYHEESTQPLEKAELVMKLSYAEGCYGGYHHTFQAGAKLWGSLSTTSEISEIVSRWLLTLEKQGCHNLVAVGASGVLQAMVLSFGSFRFSNQHLEFNMQPKFLHREYFFRRLNYGNLTHVNVSVVLQEDNKAVLFVALDRSDKKYFACDGGCLGKPVQLRQEKVTFPVKLTDPVTAILYITYDKEHMELLQHTIHVNDVVEAPAQEHHVIALHRHGHHLGGLPTLFWVSVSFLIVIFHLFLFKLIYNEYCGVQDRYRGRYGKL